MHDKHIAYFTTVRGAPLDIGVKELVGNERISVSTQLEMLNEALHFLLDAALELQLNTIVISREPVDDIPWTYKIQTSFNFFR
ncbi:hypothetical protein V1478_015536 [Vespula squamosa]|uniref:Uncharacterized protein n=1 Tax=Vespula squamosa TaxID=30214 RepID=A0ABD2A1S2_VESSQ